MPPKTEHKTREKILEATARLLGSSCLHSISIRDIAKASDTNSALISYHFGSKDKLYGAIIMHQFEAYEEQVVSTFLCEGDIRNNLKNACSAIAAFQTSNPYWLLLYFRELANPSEYYTSIILPVISKSSTKATMMIQSGISQGVFKPDINPRYVVQSFVGMINYCFMTCRLRNDLNITPTADIDEYMSFAQEMVLNHINSDPAIVKTAD